MDTSKTRKRKSPEVAHASASAFPFDELNQDLLERVLSRLPPSSFFRLRAVCKQWSNVASSATFRLACAEVQSREPWFLMVGQDLDQYSIIFDTSEARWKDIKHPNFLHQTEFSKSIPVASSGGLVCFRAPTGRFTVCNPVTGECHEVPTPTHYCDKQTLHAIAMSSPTKSLSSYRIVLVQGELPNLSVGIFDSEKKQWEDEFMLRKISLNSSSECNDVVGDELETVYFLSKAGDVVATNMQRSPSKQYSSVLAVEDGQEVAYFLSQSGTVVACNLVQRTYSEYPRLLPIYFEYSIDVVECNGEMFVVVLSDFLETASLRIWKFMQGEKLWKQVSAMPPSISHDFFGKKADINCVGWGHSILICVNSAGLSSYVMCNLDGNHWVELPKCFVNGSAVEFMSAFSFEPRMEISV